MVGNGRTAELEQAGDVVDANLLAGVEDQQNLLARGIAEGEEEAGEFFPAFGQALGEFGIHATFRQWTACKTSKRSRKHGQNSAAT